MTDDLAILDFKKLLKKMESAWTGEKKKGVWGGGGGGGGYYMHRQLTIYPNIPSNVMRY